MTLEKSALTDEILANKIQLGWWMVPMRGSLSWSEVLGIFWISDQGGSWIKMISNWFRVLRRILTMREFLQTFCEKILRFFTIIVELSHSLQNKSIWIYFHGLQRTSSIAIPYWTCVSRTDIGWSLLDDLLGNSSIWISEDMDPLFSFPILEGWSCCLLYSTIQILDGVQIYEDHCIWRILILGFCMRMLCDPTSNNFCTMVYQGLCWLPEWLRYNFWHWNIC